MMLNTDDGVRMNPYSASIKKNWRGIILILISAFTLAGGQFLWKLSLGNNPFLLVSGFALYGLGAFFMIASYRFGSLSVLHPMMSASYVFAFILGGVFLKESITLLMLLGLLIIIIGNIFVGGGDN
jgi:drug/metabolite transporter (DMT)-like permease